MSLDGSCDGSMWPEWYHKRSGDINERMKEIVLCKQRESGGKEKNKQEH